MDRIAEILISPQPEPPMPPDLVAQGVGTLSSVSWFLINPQPEPPMPQELVGQGFRVLDRISWVLINPQPEPPMLSPDLQALSIGVLFQVAGVLERTAATGLMQGTLPGLKALDQLSLHLVDAVINEQPKRAAGQVNALSRIAGKYADYYEVHGKPLQSSYLKAARKWAGWLKGS